MINCHRLELNLTLGLYLIYVYYQIGYFILIITQYKLSIQIRYFNFNVIKSSCNLHVARICINNILLLTLYIYF